MAVYDKLWTEQILPELENRGRVVLGDNGSDGCTVVNNGRVLGKEVVVEGHVLFQQNTTILCQRFSAPSKRGVITVSGEVESLTIIAKSPVTYYDGLNVSSVSAAAMGGFK